MCHHRSTTQDGFIAEAATVTQAKIIIEKHPDGYVAYPLGLKGGGSEGDSYEEAVTDVKSAIVFHMQTLGQT
jgi:predicted RNase H-like HicB family nuclease